MRIPTDAQVALVERTLTHAARWGAARPYAIGSMRQPAIELIDELGRLDEEAQSLTPSNAPIDAAQAVEPIDADDESEGYWQSQAISARARGDARAERRALDQLALIERSR